MKRPGKAAGLALARGGSLSEAIAAELANADVPATPFRSSIVTQWLALYLAEFGSSGYSADDFIDFVLAQSHPEVRDGAGLVRWYQARAARLSRELTR